MTRLLTAALAWRRERAGLGDTDAFRAADGRPDGVPGAAVDVFAGHWCVQTAGGAVPPGFVEGARDCGARSVWWKRLDEHEREPPVRLWGEALDNPFAVREHGRQFWIDFRAGYSQGLFLDQRLNREAVCGRVRDGQTLLNLFAYTCGFSIAAAAGGATTTSLDLSQRSLDWGHRNFQFNGADPTDHFFCRGDALEWLRRWARAGRRFHAVVADPPTFSRNRKGGLWRVERDTALLAEAVAAVLEPGGWALFCTNSRGVGEDEFVTQVTRGFAAAGRGPGDVTTSPMPPEFRGTPYLKSVWVEGG